MVYGFYYRKGYNDERVDGRLFYEVPKLAECELLKEISPPEDWQIDRDRTWCYLNVPEDNLPVQGWKIHVSATPKNFIDILKIVSSILFKERISFKFLANKRIFFSMISKNASRGSSGKFITVYPQNDEVFKYIIEKLYRELKDFEGPYILSDKRYKDCKVLYYRYGGILPRYKMEPTGERTSFLVAPDGSLVSDERTPYFNPPDWVEDPFPDEEDEDEEGDIILKDRYKILEAFKHSNMGGLYLAEDLKTGRTVVLKEARPFTFYLDDTHHAFHVLEREYEILKFLRENGVTSGPEVYEIFREWEHKFIVMERVEGDSMDDVAGRMTIGLIRNVGSVNMKEVYTSAFSQIFKKFALTLKDIHRLGIAHGDISVNNVFITFNDEKRTNADKVRLIDFESASVLNEELTEKFKEKDLPLHMGMFTPGFARDENRLERYPEDDLYSLGALMLHFVGGAFLTIRNINPDYYKVIYKIVQNYGLPIEMAKLIDDILNLRVSYDEIVERLDEISGKSVGDLKLQNVLPRERASDHIREFKKTLDNLKFVIEEVPYPLSAFAYNTNTLSLGFGMSGILRVLQRVYGEIDSDVMEWFINRLKDVNSGNYPPGLMIGMAGISWALWDLGMQEESIRLLKMSNEHAILFDNPSLFYGSSGVGLANLNMFFRTGDNYFLDQAVRIADHLLNSREVSDKGTSWTPGVGYGNGQAGIGLYLLYMYLLTGDRRYLDAGTEGLKYDLSFEYAPLGFPPREDIKIYTTYLEFGAAGIGKVLHRYLQALGEEFEYYADFKDRLNKILEYIKVPWVTSYVLLFGASGIADFLMDVGDPYAGGFLSIIDDMVLDTKYGKVVPSESHSRIITSFGDGLSGVIAILHRYVTGQDHGIDIWKDIQNLRKV